MTLKVTLTRQQKESWARDGFLVYDEPMLTPDQLERFRARVEEIGTQRRPIPEPEKHFGYLREFTEGKLKDVSHYDSLRKIDHLYPIDDITREVVHSDRIVDVVEELIGPDIKLYGDQFFMKPPHHGVIQAWHQDSGSWVFFAPQNLVTCWIALDDATEENGCLHYLPGSHAYGYVSPPHVNNLVAQMKETTADVLVPRRAGYGVVHHSLTLHFTGANHTPQRRRGFAVHYMPATTRYIGLPTDSVQPPFVLMRGRAVPGCV